MQTSTTIPHNGTSIDNPSALGIDPETTFAQNVPVFEHTGPNSLYPLFESYDTDPDNGVSMGDITAKTAAAFEILQRSQALLIETEPWFVNKYMQDDFDRWEPFFVAFPEVTRNRQMKFTNLAPLSEIAYRLGKRDDLRDEQAETPPHHQQPGVDETDDKTAPIIRSIIEEQKAYTRYSLDSAYLGSTESPETRGVFIDMSPITAIHAVLSPWPHHLIIGQHDDGSLYCGRGAQFDRYVDVAIDLDRRINKHGERKVAVYNDERTKDALKQLDFNSTHAKYLGPKRRWEIDIKSLNEAIPTLLNTDDVNYVSVHRVTEKAYLTHVDTGFFYKRMDNYPAWENDATQA